MADDDEDRGRFSKWLEDVRSNKRSEVNSFWQSTSGVVVAIIFLSLVVAGAIVRAFI